MPINRFIECLILGPIIISSLWFLVFTFFFLHRSHNYLFSIFASGIRGKTGSIRFPNEESWVMKYPTEFPWACSNAVLCWALVILAYSAAEGPISGVVALGILGAELITLLELPW